MFYVVHPGSIEHVPLGVTAVQNYNGGQPHSRTIWIYVFWKEIVAGTRNISSISTGFLFADGGFIPAVT